MPWFQTLGLSAESAADAVRVHTARYLHAADVCGEQPTKADDQVAAAAEAGEQPTTETDGDVADVAAALTCLEPARAAERLGALREEVSCEEMR